MTDAAPTVDPPDSGSPAAAPSALSVMPSADGIPTRAYAASWLDELIRALGALPGPWFGWVAVIGALTLGAIYTLSPLSGEAAVPAVAPTYYGLLLPGILWLFTYLNGVAGRALDDFRPLLAASAGEVEELRHRLTVVPAPGAWLLLVATVAATLAGYAVFPEAEGVVGLSAAALAFRLPYEILTTAVIFVTLYRTVRQLRLVNQIHGQAEGIDLYQPGPLYAFSSLTAQAGMGLFLLLVPLALLVPAGSGAAASAVAAAWFAILATVSVTAFVVPLGGMHVRIAAQKRELEAAVGRRLTATVEAIHRAVDAADLEVADGLNKNLTSLIAERDLVEKLPTWPWRPGTIGAFVTAMLLPIAIWVVTRLLERVV